MYIEGLTVLVKDIFYGRRKAGKGKQGKSHISQLSEGKNTRSQKLRKRVKQVGGILAREVALHSLPGGLISAMSFCLYSGKPYFLP